MAWLDLTAAARSAYGSDQEWLRQGCPPREGHRGPGGSRTITPGGGSRGIDHVRSGGGSCPRKRGGFCRVTRINPPRNPTVASQAITEPITGGPPVAGPPRAGRPLLTPRGAGPLL